MGCTHVFQSLFLPVALTDTTHHHRQPRYGTPQHLEATPLQQCQIIYILFCIRHKLPRHVFSCYIQPRDPSPHVSHSTSAVRISSAFRRRHSSTQPICKRQHIGPATLCVQRATESSIWLGSSVPALDDFRNFAAWT